MNRRLFLVALVATAGGCGKSEAPEKVQGQNSSKPPATETPGGTRRSDGAQPRSKRPHVALLIFGTRGSASGTAPTSVATLFRNRLSQLGYAEGETIVVEESYADGDPQRLNQLALEIVERKPDVIIAIAAVATAAVRQATGTIPIVMVHAGNPVGSGLVASLARPGGNVTGTTSMVPELGVKQVELLHQVIPGLARLGVLVNPTNAGHSQQLASVIDAARPRNISVTVAEVTRAEDFDKAIGMLRDARLDGLFVMIDPLVFVNRARVLDFAASHRLPASYDVGREIAHQGGLMSYGPVLNTHYALAADYVDKILRGAKPGDLHVQQPTQFRLVFNLKTAKTLNLTIPQQLLLRADEIVQ